MKKKDNFFASAHYVAPGCKVVEIKVKRPILNASTSNPLSKFTEDTEELDFE